MAQAGSIIPRSPFRHAAQRRPRARLNRASAAAQGAPEAAAAPVPSLASLPRKPIFDADGHVWPAPPDGTAASVFCVFDEGGAAAFVGFSKDIRNTLRTVAVRRPGSVYSYSHLDMPTVDQAAMVACRTAWLEELGGPPPANSSKEEGRAWQAPADAQTKEAAEEMFEEAVKALTERGLRESLALDLDLAATGQVDVLPSRARTKEDVVAEAAAREAERAARVKVVREVKGKGEIKFEVFFRQDIETGSGHMYDVVVSHGGQDTKHRVLCGDDLTEACGETHEELVIRAFAFVLAHDMPRHTDGILTGMEFPINYFTVSMLGQWFPDFGTQHGILEACNGKNWRMQRWDYSFTDKEHPFLLEPTDVEDPEEWWAINDGKGTLQVPLEREDEFEGKRNLPLDYLTELAKETGVYKSMSRRHKSGQEPVGAGA